MNGKEIHRLARGGVLRSIRDNGEIYDRDKHSRQWALWTRLDKTGIRRSAAIVAILTADGWYEMGT